MALTPGSLPVTICDRLNLSRRVDGVQPTLGAIDSTLGQSDEYSPRCSYTVRTARFRTSGENQVCFFMTSFMQELKPLPNSGRFKTGQSVTGTKLKRVDLTRFRHSILNTITR